MIRTKAYKHIIGGTLFVLALFLLCANALLIWVITGPRSLDTITPYIESAFSPPGAEFHVKIEGSELLWNGWEDPIGIHAKNIEILNGKGAVAAYFPDIQIEISLMPLLIGKIYFKTLSVEHPNILLVQGDDGSLSFGVSKTSNEADNSFSSALSFFAADNEDESLSHIKSIAIRHATLSVKKLHGNVYLQSPDAMLEIKRKSGNAKGTLTLPLQFGERKGELDANFTLNKKEKNITAEAVYTDIPSSILYELIPSQKLLGSVHMPLSGWANVTSDFDANIQKLDFLAEAGPGIIEYPSEFEKPLSIEHIHLVGGLTNKLSTLTVKEGVIDFKSFKLSASGTVQRQGDDYSIDGNANTGNINVDDVHNYWPLSLASHTRGWVIEHITKGIIEKAHIEAHFKPGELKLKDAPDQAIAASMEIKATTIQYMAKHPPVKDISGTIKFTGNTMDANITKASYLSDSHVTSANLKFLDFSAPDVRLFIDMNLDAATIDVVNFLSLPDLNKTKKLNLTQDIMGRVNGNAKLDFIAFSENENTTNSAASGHINYAMSGELQNVSQKAFMGERDVADANMKITLNSKGIKATGTAKINQLPMLLDVSSAFTHDKETSYTVKCDMPIARLPDFGLPVLSFAKGTMGVNASFVSSDTQEKSDATLDLTQTTINLPEHGFTKKAGDKAKLEFSTVHLPSGNTDISSFTYSGNGASFTGKGEFSKTANDFASLSFGGVRFGNHDLNHLDYIKKAKNISVFARGNAFDAGPYIQPKPSSGQYHYDIDVETNHLVLGKNRELKNAAVKADCAEQCRSASIKAILVDGTPFNYSIQNGTLLATCNNVGELLRVLGILDGVEGGRMVLQGGYKNTVLEGKVLVTDYTLKKAPVLAKMITIASLTGILDTLSGNGIYFKKLTAPFSFAHNIIKIKDAKTHGAALGITSDGIIDIGASTLDLQGTLVPSYTINSLIGNVPLIGDLLMGGSGKGIIAINYTIKGAMGDPSISVNPLSVLTPGFLRNIFDIFDKPTPDLDKIAADKKVNEKVTDLK
jgi:hypothetical protein